MKRGGFIYILTNFKKTVLYVGVTSDLAKRVCQHKNHHFQNSFTDKYNVTNLVYYEWYERIEEAITREKQLKKWNRAKKETLINLKNPNWRDLYEDILNEKNPLQ